MAGFTIQVVSHVMAIVAKSFNHRNLRKTRYINTASRLYSAKTFMRIDPRVIRYLVNATTPLRLVSMKKTLGIGRKQSNVSAWNSAKQIRPIASTAATQNARIAAGAARSLVRTCWSRGMASADAPWSQFIDR